ncbi:MAG: 5'-nucleotidase C-terminal domain-containing protein [Bacteroidetes bacterium]|nr:5'-nucleotidase C-terminal domain-containing protein [Bacteroidota bacterium]
MKFRWGTGLVFLIFGSGCSNPNLSSYTAFNQPVKSTLADHAIDSVIQPYREKMMAEMAEVIGYADSSLLAYTPESPLGNFAADVVFETGFQYAAENGICSDSNAVFSLLNFGGLRTSVNKGSITLGDIYELMPFDNVLVIVGITRDKMDSLVTYLVTMKGQPVSNAQFTLSPSQQGFQVGPQNVSDREVYYVITSDYLAGGGDKMNFLKDPVQFWNTGILIRDVLIAYVKKEKVIPYYPAEGRMYFP